MSRRVYLLGAGLVLVALAFGATEAMLWEPGATEANVKRIREGMTLPEVEAILGGRGSLEIEATWERHSPASQAPALARHTGRGIQYAGGPYRRRNYEWAGSHGRVSVWLHGRPGEQLRVDEAIFERSARPTVLERLRAWLGW